MVELTVTIKSSDATYKHKNLIYDAFNPNDPNDPIIKQCIQEALKSASIEPESIKIRINLEVQ